MSFSDRSRHDINWSRNSIDRLWNYYASNPSYRHQYFGLQHAKDIVTEASKQIHFGNISCVLDYGCGQGHLLAELIKQRHPGQFFHGLDFSATSILEAQILLDKLNNFCQLQHINTLPSPYSDNSIDLIFATEVIEHLTDDQLIDMLADIRRILKPNGFLFLSTPNNEDLEANKTICPDCGCVFHRWQHLRQWTAESLSEQMRFAGLKNKSIREVSFAPRWRRALSFLKPVHANTLIYVGQLPSP